MTTTGNIAVYFTSEDGLSWLSNQHIVFPMSTATAIIHALKAKVPLDLIHRIFGHINVQSIHQSIKNKTVRNLSLDDIDWSNLSKFQCVDCMQGKNQKACSHS